MRYLTRMSRARRRGLMRLAVLVVSILVVAGLLSNILGGGSDSPNLAVSTNAGGGAEAAKRYHVPPLLDRHDVYAADRPGRLSPVVRKFPYRVYVPNSESNTVSVINPRTDRVIDEFPVGEYPQHVVPSYDLKTLWVNNDGGNSLTAIDPATGRKGRTVPVEDPYNLYFTPDGRYAIVVEERDQALGFRDAHSMQLHRKLPIPCAGVNHMDFTANGRYLLASCEFDGSIVKVDVARERVVKRVVLAPGAKPQDVRISPDGKVFFIADLTENGVWVVDAKSMRTLKFIPTGAGAHGLWVTRDAKRLIVSNRGAGTFSVISFATRKVIRTWRIPGGGSPDMGGISPDGRVLWSSGRFNGVVYAMSTRNGHLLARIPVGSGPHGVCVYPLPGRYSLGHTGELR
jgi:YVTN family beta-propeller protein